MLHTLNQKTKPNIRITYIQIFKVNSDLVLRGNIIIS